MPSKYGFTTYEDQRARRAASLKAIGEAWHRLNPIVVDIMSDFVRATFGETVVVVPNNVDRPTGWRYDDWDSNSSMAISIVATEPNLELCLTQTCSGRYERATSARAKLANVLHNATGLPSYAGGKNSPELSGRTIEIWSDD